MDWGFELALALDLDREPFTGLLGLMPDSPYQDQLAAIVRA